MSSEIRTLQKRLWKRFRSDPKLWIERCLKIIDKKGVERPFKLNPFQDHYLSLLLSLYWKPYVLPNGAVVNRLQGVREVNLKSRQIGGSALINALLLHDTIFFPGTKTWLFCQDEPASKKMLEEKVRYTFNSINGKDPLIAIPPADTDNTTELGFPSIASSYSCRGPGQSPSVSRRKGRSITLRNALLSELAEWVYPEELLQGIQPALNDPTTNIFIESSPKLKGDYFWRFYMMAKRGEAGWHARFWPWYFDDQLREPLLPGEAEQIAASLQPDEIALAEKAKREHGKIIDFEQYKWRRKTQSDPTLAAKGPMAFRQEYLESDTDCFESGGTTIFRDDVHDLKTLTTCERPAIPGHMHAIGVDVADGTGGDGDASTIVVIDADTREQIYLWESNLIDSTQLHHEIFRVWQMYPGAVAIETNGIGRATIAKARSETCLVKDETGREVEMWKCWEDFLHCGHRTYDGLPTLSEKPTTIRLLRADLLEAVKHYGGLSPGPPDKIGIGLRIGSQAILDQYDDFQHLGGGKMGAPAPLHDDRIMSLAAAWRLLPELADYQRLFKKRFSAKETQAA